MIFDGLYVKTPYRPPKIDKNVDFRWKTRFWPDFAGLYCVDPLKSIKTWIFDEKPGFWPDFAGLHCNYAYNHAYMSYMAIKQRFKVILLIFMIFWQQISDFDKNFKKWSQTCVKWETRFHSATCLRFIAYASMFCSFIR